MDPLTQLSFDCASTILQQLSTADIARCETVSQGWRTWIHHWIAAVGLRLHFGTEIGGDGLGTSMTRLQRFKQLAALSANFVPGEPSSVRKYERAKDFVIAGNFCAWAKPGDAIFWQNMSCQDDGSLHDVQRLELPGLTGAGLLVEHLILGSNGYVLARVPIYAEDGDNVSDDGEGIDSKIRAYRDTLVSLEEGRELWSHLCPRDQCRWYIPLLVGEQRVYFGTVVPTGPAKPRIVAYELSSGGLLYENETIPHTLEEYGFLDTRDYCEGIPLQLIRGAVDELVLVLKPFPRVSGRLATIHLINGANGDLFQTIRLETLGNFHLAISTNREAFAVISHRSSQESDLRIEHFTRTSDGNYASTRLEMLHLQTARAPSGIAVYPFTGCALGVMEPHHVAQTTRLVACVDPEICSRLQAAPKTPVWGSSAAAEYLTTSDLRTITLPPRSRRARMRRPLRLAFPDSCSRVRFVDGHRVAARSSVDSFHHVCTVHVFDFTPRG